MAGVCGIPSNAHAVSINVTAVTPSADGSMTGYPAGEAQPDTSVISFQPGANRANNAILKVGAGGQLAFFLDQPSGSTHLVVDVNGFFLTGSVNAVYHVYFPFGEEITPVAADGEAMKFTGHQRDLGVPWTAADDLDAMHARYMNPQLGRFLSIDPVMQTSRAMGNPQLWNRYAYALNNPVVLVDPTGKDVSIGINFTTDGNDVWPEEDKRMVLALIEQFWVGLNVGKVHVFDGSQAREANKTFGLFAKKGTAAIDINRSKTAWKHGTAEVAAGAILQEPGLTRGQQLHAIANAVNHEIFTHQFGPFMSPLMFEFSFRDLALFDRGLPQYRDAQERNGTIVDSELWLRGRAAMTTGPVPVHLDDAAAARNHLKDIRLARPIGN
jgi:RHS repeat-associated protein